MAKVECPGDKNGAEGPIGRFFDERPHRIFKGHAADILSVDWSESHFIVSASLDYTVMLWNAEQDECLGVFAHFDVVSDVRFHPQVFWKISNCSKKEEIIISGSFDGKMRLWNILERRIVNWLKMPSAITSVAFSPTGTKCAAGLFDGKCFVYITDVTLFEINFAKRDLPFTLS